MKIDAFLLADAVSAPGDGKFYIHGGGLTRLSVPVLPFALPQLAVFARLEFTEDEMRAGHPLQLTLTDPEDVPVGIFPQFEGQPFTELPELAEGEQRFVVVAVNIGGIVVGRTGLHHLGLHVDQTLLRSLPLPVIHVSPERMQAPAAAPVTLRPAAVPPNRAARRRQAPKR